MVAYVRASNPFAQHAEGFTIESLLDARDRDYAGIAECIRVGVCSIDPVVTHPDFQRMGLGKAVVHACFERQRALGGRLSYIGSAPEPAPGTYLYRSLGPSSMNIISTWSVPEPA